MHNSPALLLQLAISSVVYIYAASRIVLSVVRRQQQPTSLECAYVAATSDLETFITKNTLADDVYKHVGTGVPVDKRCQFYERSFTGFDRYLAAEVCIFAAAATLFASSALMYLKVGAVERTYDAVIVWDFRYISTGIVFAATLTAVLSQLSAMSAYTFAGGCVGPAIAGFLLSIASRGVGIYQLAAFTAAAVVFAVHSLLLWHKWLPTYTAYMTPFTRLFTTMFILFSIVLWYGYQVTFLLGPHYAQVLMDGTSCFAESIPENIILVVGTIVAFYVSSDLERYVIATVLSARQMTVAAKAPVIPGQTFQTQIQQQHHQQLQVPQAPVLSHAVAPQPPMAQQKPAPATPLPLPLPPPQTTQIPPQSTIQQTPMAHLLSTIETSRKLGGIVRQLRTGHNPTNEKQM